MVTSKFWKLFLPITRPAAIFAAAPATPVAAPAAPVAAPVAPCTTFPGVKPPSPPN